MSREIDSAVRGAVGDIVYNPWSPANGGFDQQVSFWYHTNKGVLATVTLEAYKKLVRDAIIEKTNQSIANATKGMNDLAEALNPKGSLSNAQIEAVTKLVNEKVEAAYAEGYEKGYAEGYNTGWTEGFDTGAAPT